MRSLLLPFSSLSSLLTLFNFVITKNKKGKKNTSTTTWRKNSRKWKVSCFIFVSHCSLLFGCHTFCCCLSLLHTSITYSLILLCIMSFSFQQFFSVVDSVSAINAWHEISQSLFLISRFTLFRFNWRVWFNLRVENAPWKLENLFQVDETRNVEWFHDFYLIFPIICTSSNPFLIRWTRNRLRFHYINGYGEEFDNDVDQSLIIR